MSSATSLGSVGEPLRRRSLNLRARSGGRSAFSKRRGVDDELVGEEGHALVGLGGGRLGVVGDVGLLDPGGAVGFGGESEELGFGAVHEGLSLVDGGIAGEDFIGAGGAEGEERRGEEEGDESHGGSLPEQRYFAGGGAWYDQCRVGFSRSV